VYFVCRVGHSYSIPEFVAATEDVVERAMWTAVFAHEQLADLLTGLARLGLAEDFEDEARAARVGAALAHARSLREIVDRDGPLRPTVAEANPADSR
jgi:two-component system, chemotaxis family, protein-glutamate methylesterase/glutaminase